MLTIESHLVLLGLVVGTILIVLCACRRGAVVCRSFDLLMAGLPVLVIGLLCSLLLLGGRKPVLEWLLPLCGLLLLGWRCGHTSTFRIARIIAPLVAAILVFHFLLVSHTEGVTNAPRELERVSELEKSSTLGEVEKLLLSKFPPDREFPAGPVHTVVPELPLEAGVVTIKRARPEWHSQLSGLYRVDRHPETIWYPGGPVAVACKHLETRPTPVPVVQ